VKRALGFLKGSDGNIFAGHGAKKDIGPNDWFILAAITTRQKLLTRE
jgi:hypothetical protein